MTSVPPVQVIRTSDGLQWLFFEKSYMDGRPSCSNVEKGLKTLKCVKNFTNI